MKKLLVGLAILAVAGAPASAATIGVFGAGWDPDAVDNAFGGGLSLSFPLGGSGLAADLRGTYYLEADAQDLGGDDEEFFKETGLQVIPLDAALRWDFDSDGPADIYLGGGASYLLLRVKDGPDVDDELGWLAFVGARFGHDEGARFFIEGGWRGVSATMRADDIDDFIDDEGDNTDGGDEIDEDVDIDLDGLMVNLGVAWTF